MSAGKIRNTLKDDHEHTDPQVISWPNRGEYYVLGELAADLPKIGRFTPVDDPNY